MTTKEDIRRWFLRGLEKKATHLIVVCDTFDYDDYPVYVEKGKDVHEVESEYNGKSMQKVMEVYNLNMDMERQLNQNRAFNY
ncbi:MAG: hypothetical protein US50_C0004G0014 [Candidatus Nomurabacteria bacterium GW2011_GWB1_37_5]|uniref:Uncharacterized protein n=1 Tax=Candidatus Nomurabacteria bacterium GW2011_GWB1_37_5 TaxID=1618742 RepID=A0A0G0HBB9_9BACT|nr:MAG: hypothetical protein US50_C0004G0014 [Candidatus Nomurabacteria bacterium GW2011_GWB1_37_5]